MKKLITLSLVALIMVITHGCKDPCKGVTLYDQINPALQNYVFREGSYWVYSNNTDGITDSQYVYKYIQFNHVEYFDPDTISGPNHDLCLKPRYTDALEMRIISIRNNAFGDSLLIGASGYDRLTIIEHNNLPNVTGIPMFILNYTKVGLIYKNIEGSSYSYIGKINNTTSGNYFFSNVDVFSIQLNDGKSTRFTNPTDLYSASGAGIIKIIEHRPAGDVSWELVNYHIEN